MTLDECFHHQIIWHKLHLQEVETNEKLIIPTVVSLILFYFYYSMWIKNKYIFL